MPFEERQRFRQPWLWAIVLLAVLPALGVFGYGAFRQLVQHQPFGNHPVPDARLAWTGAIVVGLNLLLLWLLYRMELDVRVEPDALHVRFWPFIRRRLPYPDIRSAEARAYSPLGEYGGWGIRYGRAGKAYNVSGSQGVQLALRSGERLLLGSQRADELAAAIRARLPIR